MFIPYVNYANLFIWGYNRTFFYKKAPVLQDFWIFFSSCLPLAILAQLLYRFFPTVGTVMTYINAYVIPLLWGYRFANLQEELDTK